MTVTSAAVPSRSKKRLALVAAALLLIAGLIVAAIVLLREPGGARWGFVNPGSVAGPMGSISAEVAADLAAEGVKCVDVSWSQDATQIAMVRREINRIVLRLSRRDQPVDLRGLRYTLLDAHGRQLTVGRLDRHQSRQVEDGLVIEIADPSASDARKIVVHR